MHRCDLGRLLQGGLELACQKWLMAQPQEAKTPATAATPIVGEPRQLLDSVKSKGRSHAMKPSSFHAGWPQPAAVLRSANMATEQKHEEAETAQGARASVWSRGWQAVRRRPVTTLALAAGVGALAGWELLAAGLAGGAAVLLLQRQDLTPRLREGYAQAQR